jgi:hypothetical protein
MLSVKMGNACARKSGSLEPDLLESGLLELRTY